MKLQTFIRYALALAASFLLAACGGGGAVGNPNQGGPISASPENGTFYAGQPSTITMSGGRAPYAITSSEPGILPVPPIVNGNSFDVVPNNPGVIDVGLQAGALPVRTVVVSIRDTTGILVSINIKVAQNFLTGYSVNFVQSTCPAPATAGAALQPCAGGDTAVQMSATFNGSLHGLEQFRFDVVRGNFAFYDPLSSTNTVTPTYTTLSDHEGKVTAVIRVPAGTPSQIAIFRLTHVATGASTDEVFTIIPSTASPLTLTAIPATFTFTGTDANSCGIGSGDFLVFDGAPPYTATSTNTAVAVSPASSGTQPGRFTVTDSSLAACPTAAPVVVTDSLGNRVVVTVTSVKGPAAPAPPKLAVAPDTITLSCGASGSVTVVGGSGGYSATSTSANVQAAVSGHTVQITRLNSGASQATETVTITDGASLVTVAANVPITCP